MKRKLRDLLGKRTERKALNPAMRTMLEGLDGVYEPKGRVSAPETPQEDTTRSAVSEPTRSSSAD